MASREQDDNEEDFIYSGELWKNEKRFYTKLKLPRDIKSLTDGRKRS